MNTILKIMLADDHAVVRSGLRRLLEQGGGMQVVAEADNGDNAYHTYGDFLPDIVIMDLSMPGMGGLEALRRILSKHPNARIIVFSMHDNAAFATQALTAGARGYVAKSGMADDLLRAVREVVSGKSYISASIAQKIALQSLTGDEDPMHKLSAREFEIFRLIVEGHSVESVSELLKISQKTVANYQTILKQKLGVSSPVEMVRLAIRYGVIEG